ncbi:hypothetical protein ASF10_15600 [Flavobacterium sp. Leaf82]|uniref:DUF7619 domain-containing protein n=1 Tax=unclassified Flavobacterium TaxID=196869 RepID=UPI0006FBBFBD|nr:T9SS type A sorting domain-containing protein [Flavobacterium sp. Leaf82]KQO21001.1 hypothetical protein ASF10_15600 [Flavobacterium sp. Leaf82]
MKKLYFLIPFFFIFSINAQNSADRDPTFNDQFTLPVGSAFINDPVRQTVVQPDGKILLLEQNTDTGSLELKRLKNNILDNTLNTGIGFDKTIDEIILQPDGKIIVLGDFTTYNNVSVNKIVRLNSDGSLDKSFSASTQPIISGYFQSEIELQTDGKIVFTGTINSKLAVIRLNSNGSLDTSFSSGALFERSIEKLAIQPDGKIIVSGVATGSDGYPEGKMLRLNVNGSLDTNISPLIRKTNGVYKIAPQKDGKIIIAAGFLDANNYTTNEIIRLNADCTLDTGFATNKIDFGSSNGVQDIVTDSSGKLIVIGSIYRINNVNCDGIARLNSDGSLDTTFKSTGADNVVRSLSMLSDGRMVVAGDFRSFNKVSLNYITILRNDGIIDPSFNNIRVGFDTSSAVVFAVLPDDKLIVSAYPYVNAFRYYNGVRNKGFIRLNSDGSQDNTLTFGGATQFFISETERLYSVGLQKDAKMIIGGNFTSLFNRSANRIARLNYDGSIDNSFVTGTGFDNDVRKILVLEDNKVLVGGFFNTYKGVASGAVVRLNSDGSVDATFNAKWLKSSTGGSILIRDIILLSDGKILISVEGYDSNIVRLNSDGSKDNSFNLDTQISRYGYDISAQKDGKILVVGYKGNFGVVLRLLSDGSVDNSFKYALDNSTMVYFAGKQLDDKLLITGYQNKNTKSNFFARLNLDGSLDESFNSSFNISEINYSGEVVTQSNGKLIYFGTFENYMGVPAGGFIRLLGQDYKFVQGQNRLDLDNNGCDLNDVPFKNLKMNIQSGTSTSSLITNTTGNYTMTFLKGTHTITPVLENPSYFNISPASYTVDFPAEASPRISDFCITANGVHPDLEISILPLTVARPGFDAKYKIVYSNKGNQPLSGTISLNFDDTITDFIESYPAVSSQLVNNLKWNFANLNPTETKEITFVLNVNSPMENPPVNGGAILKYLAEISSSQTDETPANNKFVFDQVVVNSFDPNDKTCIEGDKISKTKIGDYVHYIIRFENTGTYAAQNITVKDVIDLTKYDINSLYPLSGSHLFSTEITDNNKVDFKFENINLPFDDANNDGYLAFKIKTKSTLVEGDSFGGSANIFFDYNSAITTNVPTTTIEQALGVKDFSFGQYFVVYPNPVSDVLNITTKEDIQLSSIQIYNVLGQLIRVIPNAKNVENIDVSGLNSGNYFIKIISDKGNSSTKFIKK